MDPQARRPSATLQVDWALDFVDWLDRFDRLDFDHTPVCDHRSQSRSLQSSLTPFYKTGSDCRRSKATRHKVNA